MGGTFQITADDVEWHRQPKISRDGAVRLVTELIVDASYDVMLLRRKGVISGSRINPKCVSADKHGRKSVSPKILHYKHPIDVEELLSFFKPNGALEFISEPLMLTAKADAIRRKLELKY